MRGVDLLDSLNGLYRNKLRSKKWYFRIFTHLVDMTVVCAWLLYRRALSVVGIFICRPLNEASTSTSPPKKAALSLAEFKIEVAQCLIKIDKPVVRKRGRPSHELEMKTEEKRSRGAQHPPEAIRCDQTARVDQ